MAAALMLMGAACGMADAQQQPGPVAPSMPHRVPTTFEPVDTSLSYLLNGGAKLVASGIGMSGPGVTVVKDGKYIICSIVSESGMMDSAGHAPRSECYQIN